MTSNPTSAAQLAQQVDAFRFYVVPKLATGQPVTESDYVQFFGPAGSLRFWAISFANPLKMDTFIHNLSLLGAKEWEAIDHRSAALGRALLNAYQAGEQWIIDPKRRLNGASYFREVKQREDIKVLGRQATTWLLANPWTESLVPEALTAYLRSTNPTSETVSTMPPARPSLGGRKPKYDWMTVAERLARHLADEGAPKEGDGGMATLERLVTSWFPPDGLPAESSIREHVRRAITIHRASLG